MQEGDESMVKKQKSFEEQLTRLREIHTALESGNHSIEEMLLAYEEGMKLVSELQEFLENTEQRVIDISKRYNAQKEDSENDGDDVDDLDDEV
ncbi:MAG: exodeoxyribonuclease VII small subunit [Candidatus Kapaibacterium sp.]